MKTYSTAIILPPKIYLYEPKIFGFKLFGKRGSKYHRPVIGSVKHTEEEENVELLIQ